jgi:type IV secretory pathway VirB2 component (pilin)
MTFFCRSAAIIVVCSLVLQGEISFYLCLLVVSGIVLIPNFSPSLMQSAKWAYLVLLGRGK